MNRSRVRTYGQCGRGLWIWSGRDWAIGRGRPAATENQVMKKMLEPVREATFLLFLTRQLASLDLKSENHRINMHLDTMSPIL